MRKYFPYCTRHCAITTTYNIVLSNKLKLAAVGKSIMQAARPRKILSPFQFRLAVQMQHHNRSGNVIDTLNRLGFSSSSNEVFERNACMNGEKFLTGQITEESTLHFVADNNDHNTCTVNGDNTMHGMGIIAADTKGQIYSD